MWGNNAAEAVITVVSPQIVFVSSEYFCQEQRWKLRHKIQVLSLRQSNI